LVVIELIVSRPPVVGKSGIESTFSPMAVAKFGVLSIVDLIMFGSASLPDTAISTLTFTEPGAKRMLISPVDSPVTFAKVCTIAPSSFARIGFVNPL